ncbi:PIG-L family deacetylase [Streptomyces sp. NPDC001744]|uniref:PIG-L family deacetylase n=1 Tax=Streptomyces sp. NPDC001744 TaxID=3364606 RepID=UPI0036CDC48A
MQHTTPRRRTVLAGALAGASAVAGCSVPEPRRAGPTADPAPGKPVAPTPPHRALLMQFAAHPDDDLYFMNPDSQRLIDAGVPLVSVYVTAGEHNGRNRIAGMPAARPDRAAYSAARHQGLRQSYAVALGLPVFTPWRRGVLTLPGGRRAEIDTLTHGTRRIELVFLNLPMHAPRRYMALPALWKDRSLEVRTHLSADSPLTRPDTYDYDGLVEVLAGLLARYRPTVVHTLDPDPDIQHGTDAARRNDAEQPGYEDHGDHTAVACFTWAALCRRVADAVRDGEPVPAFTTTAFRGYYNRHWPKNLPPGVLKEKAARLVPYGGNPSWRCGNPSGCGDYGVGGTRPLTNRKGWVRSTHHRWPGARPVLAEEPDGRLTAYGVLGLRAVRRRETAPGGAWGEPEDLGGGPLAPALGSAVLDDGRTLLFGVRFAALDGHGGANRREVVLLEQRSPGGPFLAWRGLGNPEHTSDRGRRIGSPVAVATPDGRVHLFVRNADKHVSTRVRAADGTWGPWRTLPGDAEVQDGLAVSVDGAGRTHLYAAGRESVRHWVDGTERTERLPLSGSTVASANGALYHRPPASGKLLGPRGDAGLDGYGGVVAAHSAALGTVLLGTDPRGRATVRAGGRRRTRTSGGPVVSAALHLGARGATVVGAGADGRLWSWRP